MLLNGSANKLSLGAEVYADMQLAVLYNEDGLHFGMLLINITFLG
jgi:hypothetical protein